MGAFWRDNARVEQGQPQSRQLLLGESASATEKYSDDGQQLNATEVKSNIEPRCRLFLEERPGLLA